MFADFVPPPTARAAPSAPTSPSPAPTRPRRCRPRAAPPTVDGYTVTLDRRPDAGAETRADAQRSAGTAARSPTCSPTSARTGTWSRCAPATWPTCTCTRTASPATASTAPGPHIDFATTAPSAGAYRLFLDFQHGGVVRTAAFTVDGDRGGDDHDRTAADVELAHRRDDLRLVRGPHREEAQPLDGVTATVNYATEKAKVTLRRRRRPPTT